MLRSILNKDKLLYDLGITDVEWPVYGYPHKIHVDNGPDFQSLNLKKSCALHGINIEFRPLARPEFGGHIERLIGSFMTKIHEIPGTTFSNLSQRIEYDSEKNAIFTFDEFEKYIALHISKVYHLTNHSSLGIAPIQKWRIGIFGDSMNDITMLQDCGTGIAMGNSTEELKKCADYVTNDASHDGIYNAMKHFQII